MKLINNRKVKGKGFEIEVLNVHHLEYRELNIKVDIEIEGSTNQNGLLIWNIYITEILYADSPKGQFALSIIKRNEIISRIDKGLDLLSMKHIIEHL